VKYSIYFLVFLSIPFFSKAQSRNSLFTIAASADFANNTHVLGGHFSANAQLSRNIYLGAGFGIGEFHSDNNLYFPIYANFLFLPRINRSNLKLLLNIAPGYGIYNRQYNVNPIDRGFTEVKETGGFYFYTGIGIMEASSRGKPFVSAGYARYTFNNYSYTYARDAVAFRVGIGL
jgi:hypothetical protein